MTMKYLTLLTAAIAIMFTASAKTLEEVKAEYKDGTTVYNFRYKGTGKDRVRFDTIKPLNGSITINKVSDPEVVVYKDTDRDYERLSKIGKIISVTTNSHNKVTYVYRRHGEEKSEIYVKFLQKPVSVNAPVAQKPLRSSNAQTLKATSVSSDVPKKPWQYNHSDIKTYTDVPYNDIVSSKNKTLLTASVQDEDPAKKLEYDGGYYIMNDGGRVSYRDALNQGWADDPTNELQMNVFLEVTSDPNSLWTKRNMFDKYPLLIKQTVKDYSPSIPSNY